MIVRACVQCSELCSCHLFLLPCVQIGKGVVAVGAMNGRASGVSTIGLEVVKIVMVSIRVGGTKTQSAVATGSQAVHGSTTQPAVASGMGGTKTQPAVATGSQAIDGSDPSQL